MEELNGESAAMTVVQFQEANGDLVIVLTGELDISNSEAFRERVQQAVTLGPKRLVFDLSQLSFMDSSGIAVLMYAANSVDDIEVRNPSNVIRRIIQSTGLSEILHLTPS